MMKFPLSAPQAGRGRWLVCVKAAVTVAILGFLFTRIDLSASVRAVQEALWFWVVLALLANSLALAISTYKWDGLLRALGIFAPRGKLLELYTIGIFMSSFLPGMVGGDIVRWHLTGSETGGRLKVAASILLERATGVIALFVLCLAVIVVVPRFATLPVLALLACAGLVLMSGLALALNRRLAVLATFRTRRLAIHRLLRPVYKLHCTIRQCQCRPLAVALCFSLLFYLSVGLVTFAIAMAIGVDVSYFEAASVQALTSLILVLPISIGGLGLAQVSDVYLFGHLGIGAPEALAISLVRILIKYGYAVIGAMLFVRWGRHQRSAETAL